MTHAKSEKKEKVWSKTELATTSVEEVENFYRQLVPSFHKLLRILLQNIIKLISTNKMIPK